MKNRSQLCPFLRATRAGQKAKATRIKNPTIPIPAHAHTPRVASRVAFSVVARQVMIAALG